MAIVLSTAAHPADRPSSGLEERLTRSAGESHYSYQVVLEQFRPVLAELDEVVRVERPEVEVDAVHERCRSAGEPCVHLSFAPPQLTPLGLACPTVPVFAWEFPEIPVEAWGDDERNDWSLVFRRVGRAITHSSFCVEVVRRVMGAEYPILSCPSPVWDSFRESGRHPDPLAPRTIPIPRGAFVIDTGELRGPRGEPCGMSASIRLNLDPTSHAEPAQDVSSHLNLSGVVYTSVFNPGDFRKSWREMLTSFCRAFRDTPDAVLLLKFVHWNHGFYLPQLQDVLFRQPRFRCRVVAIGGFLDEAAYEAMVRATTFALSASTGEGQCLPLMELMSAGKPAVSPRHTAMLDYIDEENGFVVAGHQQEASFPQDPRGKLLTSAFRFSPDSFVRALRASYSAAKEEPARYRTMSRNATDRLEAHCSQRVAVERLRAFLDLSSRPS